MEKILIIDDSEDILKTAKTYLSEIYEVLTAKFGEKGIEIFKKERPAVVISDIKMPGMDGVDVLREIKSIDENVDVILMTGNGDMDDVIKSLRFGAADFILKPMDVGLLEISIEKALDKHRAVDEINRVLNEIRMSITNLWIKLSITSMIQCINENVELNPEILKEELEKINAIYERWEGYPQSV